MKVCVIGAGVVGCATAYQLSRMGHEVTLVDSAPEPASGASFANGAQLSYSFVEPLANPGTFRAIPKMDRRVFAQLRSDSLTRRPSGIAGNGVSQPENE
jgi:glycine/D-amino acid oxidase-like deaminating enzyme